MPGSHSKKDKLKKKVAKTKKARKDHNLDEIKRDMKDYERSFEMEDRMSNRDRLESMSRRKVDYGVLTPEGLNKTPVVRTQAWKEKMKNTKKKLAKIRKANGGIAPNYNNPSKVRKKKTATKAAAKSKSGYLGDASVNIPWGDPDLGDEVNITFRDMAQFHRKNMWVNKQGTYPQICNLGPLTGEGQGAREIFDAAHDAENMFMEELGQKKYQTQMESQLAHMIKEYGPDPDNDTETLAKV